MIRGLMRDYGLSIALAALFLVSWSIQSVSGWIHFSAEQSQHGSGASLFGSEGYVWPWLEATFENWQSEFLQLFTFVVLTVFLIHRHSHESRDEQDEMKAEVSQVLRTVKNLEKRISAMEKE